MLRGINSSVMQDMYYVYVIKSIGYNWVYVGMTENLEKRLASHNTKKVLSTKFKAPFKLVYFEEVFTSQEARIKEKYFKTNAGKEYLKRRLIL